MKGGGGVAPPPTPTAFQAVYPCCICLQREALKNAVFRGFKETNLI